MPKINVHDAQTNLTRLIERALAGEDVIVARDGQALVRLVPVDGGLRPVGLHAAALSDAEANEAIHPLGESERALWEGDVRPPEEP